MNKKGAVELSMTTIIIIVIGITILSLGLVWIRSVFSDVGQLTKGAFEQAEGQIQDIFSGTNQPIALSPSETAVSQNGKETANLIINNLGSSTVSVSVQAKSIALGGSEAKTLICAFADTLTSTSATYSLSSGKGVKLQVITQDQGSPLGTYSCVLTISGLSEGPEVTSLIVTIEK